MLNLEFVESKTMPEHELSFYDCFKKKNKKQRTSQQQQANQIKPILYQG